VQTLHHQSIVCHFCHYCHYCHYYFFSPFLNKKEDFLTNFVAFLQNKWKKMMIV